MGRPGGTDMTYGGTTIPIARADGPSSAFEYITTKKDELVGWAR